MKNRRTCHLLLALSLGPLACSPTSEPTSPWSDFPDYESIDSSSAVVEVFETKAARKEDKESALQAIAIQPGKPGRYAMLRVANPLIHEKPDWGSYLSVGVAGRDSSKPEHQLNAALSNRAAVLNFQDYCKRVGFEEAAILIYTEDETYYGIELDEIRTEHLPFRE